MPGEITELLKSAREGDREARDQLFQTVYGELRRLANIKLSGESTLTQLDAGSLVHEAYLRLQRLPDLPGADRRGFFAYAAGVMRSVIVDYVRERRAEKRGGDSPHLTLTSGLAEGEADSGPAPDIEALDAAMQELAGVDARCHQIVEMRYFAGLTIDEISAVLGISEVTVKRDWRKARAFLLRVLEA